MTPADCDATVAVLRADLARAVPDPAGDGPTSQFDAVCTDVLGRLAKPQRHYHGVQHVLEVRAALAALGHADTVPLLAAWLHDVVYDPRATAGANEADSAAYARHTLTALGIDAATVGAVATIISATATHDAAHASAADAGEDVAPATLRAFLDADLWILSAPRERFDAYCAQVRAEYAFVDEATYARARSRILAGFAERPRLYVSSRAHAWEGRARENLALELSRQSSR